MFTLIIILYRFIHLQKHHDPKNNKSQIFRTNNKFLRCFRRVYYKFVDIFFSKGWTSFSKKKILAISKEWNPPFEPSSKQTITNKFLTRQSQWYNIPHSCSNLSVFIHFPNIIFLLPSNISKAYNIKDMYLLSWTCPALLSKSSAACCDHNVSHVECWAYIPQAAWN